MLLAIDIGNTNISFGVLKGKTVKDVITVETGQSAPKRKRAVDAALKRVQRKYPGITQAAVCSVVPKVLPTVRSGVKHHLNITAKVIGRDIKVPIKNRYRKPRQVGQDRLVCAYAAGKLYGAPAIIIDFGTAITFDVISQQGAYEGGLIVPGIRMSADSLHKKTALLPQIPIKSAPRGVIGKTTKESILSGLFHGYGAMCCGLIDRIAKTLPKKPKVIVTGGHTDLIKRDIAPKITKIDKNLVFKGLYLLSKPL